MEFMTDQSRVKSYFDEAAIGYSKRSHRGLWKWLRNNEARVISRLIGGGELGDVLELGSGDGYYANLLSQQGCQSLICVDISLEMLEQCSIPNCTKVVADIQEYLSQDRFNLILCAGALEFLQRPADVLRNAAQMLKDDGTFVVLMPRLSILGRIYQLYHRVHGIPPRLFRLFEIRRWANETGLHIVHWQEVPLFSLVVKFSKGVVSNEPK